jgi:ribonuclease VapC
VRAGVVVDTSALLAVLFAEPERQPALDAISDAGARWMSAFSYLEASIVARSRRGLAGRTILDGLLREFGVEIVALDQEQAEIARDAWERFGKGRHQAALNIGDCCAYALSRSLGAPLLFKGHDFVHCDVDGIRLDAPPLPPAAAADPGPEPDAST